MVKTTKILRKLLGTQIFSGTNIEYFNNTGIIYFKAETLNITKNTDSNYITKPT